MPPLSMVPSRLLPIASLLSQDGSCILSAGAGLEPEDHLRQTCVFWPDGTSSSCTKAPFDLEAGVIVVMADCSTKDVFAEYRGHEKNTETSGEE